MKTSPAAVADDATSPQTGSTAQQGSEPGRLTGEAETEERASAGFSVRLENFEGPFDLLLQLISRHKLDITEVALSQVTDEFIAHIKAMGSDWDLDQTSQFVVVGATLLDLKAARLLPSGEIEDPEDLELLEARDLLFARLLQYRAFKQVADRFELMLADQARRSGRTAGPDPEFLQLLPELTISTTPEGLAEIAAQALRPKPANEPTVALSHLHATVVSVREQAELVIDRLRRQGDCGFEDLVCDSPDSLTTVCRFLALLELFREQAVLFEQPAPLGRLTIRWANPTNLQLTISDEFDTGPRPAPEQQAGDAGPTGTAESLPAGTAESLQAGQQSEPVAEQQSSDLDGDLMGREHPAGEDDG